MSSANHMDVGCFREFLVALIDNNCRPALRAWKSISKFVGPAIQHDHCWKACRHFDCAIVAVPDFDRLSASFLFLLLSIFFSAGWHESSLGWCGYVVSRFPLFVLCIFPFFQILANVHEGNNRNGLGPGYFLPFDAWFICVVSFCRGKPYISIFK